LCSLSITQAQKRNELLDERVDEAIQKAIKWFTSDTEKNFLPHTFLLYSFLERKFSAPTIVNHVDYLENIRTKEKFYKPIQPFLRVIDSMAVLTAHDMVSIKSPVDKLLASAVWADKYKLPDNYINNLDFHLEQGRYNMTHVYFGIQFLREHNHPILKTKELIEIEKKALKYLKQLIAESDLEDISIEAINFLTYRGEDKSYLTSDLIDNLLQKQLPSGAWYYSQEIQKEEQHTVILALWWLYEYRYPDAPYTTMILFPKK
jgi:hypothetical protein